jgi:predicted HTH transcriptional regulator
LNEYPLRLCPVTITDGEIFMKSDELQNLVTGLCSHGVESECVEFKCNNEDPEKIGEYISALSNAAALKGESRGYLVFGVDDLANIVGTQFLPKKKKIGNEELENWLLKLLKPSIEVCIHEVLVRGFAIVVFEIQAAFSHPVQFKDIAFVRVGTYKKKLKDYPQKEKKLREMLQNLPFENGIAKDSLTAEQVLQELDYVSYFELMKQLLPDNHASIIQRLKSHEIIIEDVSGRYSITNVGAILFANDLEKFGRLGRKALRVIIYHGPNRINTIKEHLFKKGYAAAFTELIEYINDQLPRSEIIGEALRKEVRVYPEIAIRELVANALIHQDFTQSGNGPMVEIFDNRVEITNPGKPLIDTLRFIDEPPRSRNEGLTKLMRLLNICEERGSGIDKVIFQIELYQLTPPDFRATEGSTIAVLFQPATVDKMGKEDRIRACYQHACLQWVSGAQMTNSSLRKRLAIDDSNYPIASRIIKDAINDNLVKSYGELTSKKSAKYVPYWA